MKVKKKEPGNSLSEEREPQMPAKIIRTRSGKVIKQYPRNPGYHGIQDEAGLNPEE